MPHPVLGDKTISNVIVSSLSLIILGVVVVCLSVVLGGCSGRSELKIFHPNT